MAEAQKRDFRKELKNLYGPSRKAVVEVYVPKMHFLMVDGRGDPNTVAEYRQAVEALFSVSYSVKFAIRKESSTDYGVMPLEGLWWTDDGEKESGSILSERDSWRWTAMIMQPAPVTRKHIERAIVSVADRKDLPGLEKMRFDSLMEGRAAQVLYVGPYSGEWPDIERVHAFIEERGCTPVGTHHEIYLKDPRRTSPENLRTVIRQPFAD